MVRRRSRRASNRPVRRDLDPEEGRDLRSFAAEIERAAERLTADRLQSEIAELRARLSESRGV